MCTLWNSCNSMRNCSAPRRLKHNLLMLRRMLRDSKFVRITENTFDRRSFKLFPTFRRLNVLSSLFIQLDDFHGIRLLNWFKKINQSHPVFCRTLCQQQLMAFLIYFFIIWWCFGKDLVVFEPGMVQSGYRHWLLITPITDLTFALKIKILLSVLRIIRGWNVTK